MKAIIRVLYLFLSISFFFRNLHAEDSKITIGNTTEYFESRYSKSNDKIKNNLFASYQYKNSENI